MTCSIDHAAVPPAPPGTRALPAVVLEGSGAHAAPSVHGADEHCEVGEHLVPAGEPVHPAVKEVDIDVKGLPRRAWSTAI